MAVVKRKLAVLLAADVAEYSRHVRANEESAVANLRGHRAIIDQLIAQHDGRIANTAGDSVLAEFSSPVEAVRCAIEMQEAVRGRNADLPEAARMWFRIGINLGDVMVQESGDLLGDGVNVAARLQALAQPGDICIAANVREQVENKVALALDDLGDQQVKNIPQPIRVFKLRAGTGGLASPPQARASHRSVIIASIALLAVAAVAGGWYASRLVSPRNSYDGTWAGPYSCAASGRLPEINQHRVAVVRDGELVMSRGTAGEQGFFEVKGKVSREGDVSLSGHGIGPAGTYTVELTGKVAEDTMSLDGFQNGVRQCHAALKRTGNAPAQ